MRHSSSVSSWVSLKLRVSVRIERERSFNFWLSTAREFWWWSQWTMGVAANEKVALVPSTLNRFNFIEFVSRTAGRESSRTKKSVPASSCWNCPQTTSRSKLVPRRGKILVFKKSNTELESGNAFGFSAGGADANWKVSEQPAVVTRILILKILILSLIWTAQWINVQNVPRAPVKLWKY